MFALYFSILSAITPPVALAVFAAAGLAKANMWEAGFAAMRAAAPAYIIPFMFVFEPSLLLIVKDWESQWLSVLWSFCTATIGVIALAGGLFGWFIGIANAWQRLVLITAALTLITPGLVSDSVGLSLLVLVGFAQARLKRSSETSF
jgi:TRAP-type uncharacterized transport system fused permease subunit